MRVRGRKIWASTLEERRVLMKLGGVPLRVPRGVSPYMVARRLSRAAASEHPDVVFVREALAQRATARASGVAAASTDASTTNGSGAVAA